MAKLLYLVHRLPYPPNKGDKVRSYHLLKHLAARHQVFLGTFIDDPDDEQHLPRVQALCAGLHVARLNPRWARVASLAGLLRGEPLTVTYYRDSGLARWVQDTMRDHQIDATVVFSSAMAQHAPVHPGKPLLVDFVDVDAAKWTAYAKEHRWPLSWIYRREGEQLLAFDSAVAKRSTRSFWTTEKEAALFQQMAPDCAPVIDHFGNGVDTDFFEPLPDRASPFRGDEIPLVFTGAMDYWPNVDAVSWFVQEALPALRQRWPGACLHIVGRSPTKAVLALAGDAVKVTGTVPDVRPYLQHARVVVAPLRLARGVQNKVLEAMAMARPVVAAASCAEALGAGQAQGVLPAQEAADYVAAVGALLEAPERAAQMGQAARACVLSRFAWDAHLARLDRYLPSA
jgi:sugar transferase (PEP-CTERM/EpsH1 system associated)